MQSQTLNSIIPASSLLAVESALSQTFGTTTVAEIILLAGGLSASSVFKIVVNNQSYILKVDSSSGIVKTPSISCMEVAAEAGIAPRVYYLNKAAGVTITGFIKNIPLQAVYKSPEVLLPEISKTIKRMHELPALPTENSLLDTIDGLIAQFKTSGMLTGVAFDECFAYYDEIRKYYPWNDADKVFSHNDLNPNNMVFDGEKIWIIDWDAAFTNDRYVDLAITANFYVANDEHENVFLESYFGNGLTNYHKARFFLMRQICRLVYAMLMFKLAYMSNSGTAHDPDMEGISLKNVKENLGTGEISLASYEGQLLFGKALINEALNSMRSPRFVASIAQMT
ncbi:phosphotransferase [Mucilaginibacter rubeus]|uniref:Phosphotransferase n=1 Tax=Mucilaginibacter rubeus TaxID=2027860 RepID=A0A5C1HZH0_9SPHI|nr:phosphotransferase [Mucilaginibacter rubeus]QEM11013.1 phosphotransferase [Mucilaginibacter rubeus]